MTMMHRILVNLKRKEVWIIIDILLLKEMEAEGE